MSPPTAELQSLVDLAYMPDSDTPLFYPAKPLYWQYLKSGLVAANGVEKRKTILLLLSLTLVFVTILFSINRLLSDIKPPAQVLGESNEQPTPTPIPTSLPITPSPTGIPPILVFTATVSAKPALLAHPGLFLADVLVDALKLPLIVGPPFPVNRILYDAAANPPPGDTRPDPFNGQYIIVLSYPTEVPKQAESVYLSVRTQPLSEAWMPYLLDPTYCQSSTECDLRVSQCQENAFNRFELFMDVP